MRIEEGSLGSLVVHGTPEEWNTFRTELEAIYRELKHDVLPAAEQPESGGVIVDGNEAFAIMAIMGDEELTRSLLGLILEKGRNDASSVRRQQN